MAFYIRKIARSKWQTNPLSDDEETACREISATRADAITNCIKTTGDKLSLWRGEEKTDKIDDIIPLIVGFDRPDICDIIYIQEEDLLNAGFSIEQSVEDANVSIESLKEQHYNALIKDYSGLGKFAGVVLKSLTNYKRFKRNEVKQKLKDMLDNKEITKGMISDNLYEKISS